MTEEGLLNKKGYPLLKGYFYTMLTNELFAGWIVKFGERHRGTFTPIVSDELFNHVQSVLKHKGRKHSAYITDHPDFPLRKFVINQDGKKLTGSWSKGRSKSYPFYRFGGNSSNHNRDKFEETFMTFVDEYSFDDTRLGRLKELVRENLVKATLDQNKESERLKKYINELTEKQTGIIRKNLDGIIPDNVLKQQLGLIEKELLNANASLAIMPNTETNYEEAVEFLEGYLKKPSALWKDAKIGVKTKLQWFQFPLGLTFQNNFFGTSEMCLFFKTKSALSGVESSKVDFRVQFWNQFARECEYLIRIIHEYEGDKQSSNN
jgi:site-specific DNA recombinase